MYYGGFGYKEAYFLPIWQRVWFIQRMQEEFKRSNNEQTRAAHANSPEHRAMMGRSRTDAPANLRRFT
jgi:hypothetical protein